jgi:single-stranded-DNA-specific exonuclease
MEGFDLFEAINKAGEYLIDFGGHKQACGIKIEKEKIGLFREKLNAVAQQYLVRKAPLIPELKIDMQLPFAHVGVKLINELWMLMPYSSDNRAPVFCSCGLKVKNTPRNIGRNGFKFLAICGGITCEAITFKKNSITKPRAGDIIDLAYTPSINNWSGIESIQLNISDLKIVEGLD